MDAPTLILEVHADPSGLSLLAKEFQKLDATIAATAKQASAALKSIGANGGSAELTRLRAELDQATASIRTMQAQNDILTKKIEEGAARRVGAARAGGAAVQAEADEHVNAFKRTMKQAEVADGEMRRLKIQRGYENAKFEADSRAATATTVEMQIAADIKRTIVAEREAAKRTALAERSAAKQVAADSRAFAADARAQQALASAQAAAAAKAEAAAYHDLNGAARGLSGGMGQLWLTYGSFIPLIAGFAVASSIKKMIELGSEFGYQMKFIGAIGGQTAEQMKGVDAVFMQMAETSLFSSVQVARGARTLVQAGFSVSESIKVLPNLLKFSTLGEIELAQGAEIASGTMHAFGLTVADMPHILDSTAKAAQISQTNISEMGQALRQSSSVAQQFGISIDEMNAFLAVLAERNIRGSAAGTAMMNMLRELDPHTEKGKRAFKELGISVYDAAGNMKSAIPLMQEFSDRFAQFDKQSQNRLAIDYLNNRGAKAFLTAIAGSTDALKKMYEEISNGSGTLDKQASQINDTFKVQGTEAIHAFQNALIQAFQSIEPDLADMVKGFKSVFQSEEMRSGLRDLASGFMLIATTLVTIVSLMKELDHYTLGFVRDRAGALGSELGQALGDWADILQGRGIGVFKGRNSATRVNSQSELDAARAAREARENRERIAAQVAAEVTDARAAMRRGEAANLDAGGSLGYGNYAKTPALSHYDRGEAQKAAEDAAKIAVMRENARYKELETASQASYNAQLAILRAYHSARLIDDNTLEQRETDMAAAHNRQELDAFNVHVSALLEQRKILSEKKKDLAHIDIEIDKAYQENFARRSKFEQQAVQDAVKGWKKYNDTGQSVLDTARKSNEELKAEIKDLSDLSTVKKDHTLLTIEGRIATEESTLATLEQSTVYLAQSEFLTAKQVLDLAELEVIRKRIELLKKERDVRKGLLAERESVENDWVVGAVKGLNQYLEHGMSTASIVADAFKKGFSAMEDALVNFVKTGKLNLKGFLTSIADDLLRMLVRMNITQPLAQALRGGLSGGMGAGLIGGASSFLGDYNPFSSSNTSSVGPVQGFSLMNNTWGGINNPWASALGGAGVGAGIGSAAHAAFGNERNGQGMSMGGMVGGAIGSIWGPIGTIIGSAIGTAIGSLISSGGGPKDGGSFYGQYDARGNLTGHPTQGTQNGRFFTPNSLDDSLQTAVAANTQGFFGTLAALGGTSRGISFGLGYDTDPKGTAPNRISSSVLDAEGRRIFGSKDRDVGRDPDRLKAEIGNELARMTLAGLKASDLPEDIRKILNTVSETATSDVISGVIALAAAYKDLKDSLVDLNTDSIIAKAGRTAVEAFHDGGQTLLELARKADFSASSLNNLRNATGEFANAAAQLVIEMESAKRSIDDMFANTIRDIRLAGLDDQGKYNFYQNEANNLLTQAQGSTSVSEIQRLSQQINQDMMSAFQLLSPEQQRATQAEWIRHAEETNLALRTHLATLQEELKTDANSVLHDIRDILDANAAKYEDAADKQVDAANKNLAVAGNQTLIIRVEDGRIVTNLVTDGG